MRHFIQYCQHYIITSDLAQIRCTVGNAEYSASHVFHTHYVAIRFIPLTYGCKSYGIVFCFSSFFLSSGLPSVSSEEVREESWKAPIRVTFEIPYFTVSGIQVRYLKIIEKSGYQALPWVRYITKNGKYELRIT